MTTKPKRPLWRRVLRIIGYLLLIGFILANIVAYNHAYYFTHFADSNTPKLDIKEVENFSLWQKIGLLFWGVAVPKSQNGQQPQDMMEVVNLRSSKNLEAWFIPIWQPNAKGTVILCHGYGASKSSLLQEARQFRGMGYHTFLIDFRGHGNSEGVMTTIGAGEAEDVKAAYDYIQERMPDSPIVLYGVSMGAVSILKAVHDYDFAAERVIVSCPFGSLRQAVLNRFEMMGAPSFLAADLLMFWGSVQGGFWAYSHHVPTYAAKLKVPTLLLYGEHDPKVKRSEIDLVFESMTCPKKLEVFECGGHDDMYSSCVEEWYAVVSQFMNE
ncbi:MAG: alpha/beta hydrolase [Aureispira sp.]|nr:alpha/beta hydrolase [Aureispira sp.]